jgi:hypothetical protein
VGYAKFTHVDQLNNVKQYYDKQRTTNNEQQPALSLPKGTTNNQKTGLINQQKV